MGASDRPDPAQHGSDDPDPALRQEFWVLVVVFDIAVLGVGAGAMLVYFGVRPSIGWAAIVVGVGAFGYGYGRYRRRERDR